MLLPKVHYHLLCFANIQEEVVVLTPAGQGLYLLNLLVIRPTTAVSLANLMMVLA